MKIFKYILIGIVVIFIGFIIYYFLTRNKYSKVTDVVNPVKEPTEPVPYDAPPLPPPSNPQQSTPEPKASGWIKEYFPLSVRMYGDKTRLVQRALGIDDYGKFGNNTKNSVISAGYTVPLSEADFNKITATKSASSVPKTGDTLESNKDGVQLYDEGLHPTVTKNQNDFIGYAIDVNTNTNLIKFHYSSGYGYVYINDVQTA